MTSELLDKRFQAIGTNVFMRVKAHGDSYWVVDLSISGGPLIEAVLDSVEFGHLRSSMNEIEGNENEEAADFIRRTGDLPPLLYQS